MRKCLERRRASAENGDLQACFEADLDFHTAVAIATHNRILADIYRLASERYLHEFNRIYENTQCFIDSQPSHEKLLSCIVGSDLKNAGKVARIIVEEP